MNDMKDLTVINNDGMKIFENSEFGQVRAIQDNSNIWFVAKDVCEVLEISDSNKTLARLKENYESIQVDIGSSISKHPLLTNGGTQFLTTISESCLYDLIMQSRKPNALKFKHWVTSEVLPSIRKNEFYATDNWVESALSNPDGMIAILTKYKEERQARLLAEQTIEEQKPKVEYFDGLVERNLLSSFRVCAKELKVPERQFIQFLEEKKYIYRDAKKKIQPYAQFVPSLFEIKEWKNEHKAGQQVLITIKGRETFRLLTEHLKKE